ncbi:Coiled-coil domain-containing protein 39 [Nymphon striatum]|nr:Coiled-coil domain-containing protein 39 [Nymphon striatum]
MQSVSTIISEIGWDTKYSLPVANAENIILLKEIEEKEKRIVELKAAIKDEKDRVSTIKHHISNFSQDLQISQNFYKSKQKEVETEENMKRHILTEIGWLTQTVKELNAQYKLLKSKLAGHQCNLMRVNKKIDDLDQKLQLDNNAFELWEMQSAVLDEDYEVIMKLSEEDKKKLKLHGIPPNTCGAIMLAVAGEVEKKEKPKRRWVDGITKFDSNRLDKMSDKFRKLHKDRQHLIRQCSSAVAEIQLRDKDIIENLCCDFANAKTEANDQRNFLKEDYEVLEEEKRHNDKLQEELRNLKLTKKALDGEYDKAKAESLPAGELEALRNFLQNISSDLDKNRQLCLQLDLQIKTKTESLTKLKEAKDKLQFYFKNLKEEKSDDDYKAVYLDQFLSEEEMRKRKYEKELSKIEKLQFNTLQEVKHVESNTTTLYIIGMKLDEINRILSENDFMLQKLDYRIERVSGDNKYEEKANLERRLQQLRMTHEEKMKLNNTLQSHLSVVTRELKQAEEIIESDTAKKLNMKSEYKKYDLENDILLKELKTVDEERLENHYALTSGTLNFFMPETMPMAEASLTHFCCHLTRPTNMTVVNKIVEESLLKLEVKRLNEMLLKFADNVLLLENQRVDFHKAINEKNNDITSHMERLKNTLKQEEIEIWEREGKENFKVKARTSHHPFGKALAISSEKVVVASQLVEADLVV